MNITQLARLPFSGNGAWSELRRLDLSIPFLAWVVVVPMSFLPPVLLYYAGTQYGDAVMQGFGDKEWRFITTILFLAELPTSLVIGWLCLLYTLDPADVYGCLIQFVVHSCCIVEEK